MSEVLTPIVYQLGIGGVLGFIVGYAIKKLTKIMAVLAGLCILLLIYLGYEGIIIVDYNKLAAMLEKILGKASQVSSWLVPIIAYLPFAGSFIAGAIIGLKTG